jgi:hypothetical protein
MRHIGTLIAAILITPLAWILLAYGQQRSIDVFADGQTVQSGDLIRPLEVLAAAGLLLGILATLRFSPLGAMVSGLTYTTSYGALLVAPAGTLRFLGHGVSLARRHIDLATPVRNGTTLVLGTLLLLALFSVKRWRRWPRPEDAVFDDDGDRPVGIDGLDLRPEPARSQPSRQRVPEPEAEPEPSGWRHNGFRPVPISGVPSPWGRRAERARW